MTPTMKIKLFDPTLPLPQYHTAGAVGLDLYAREKTTIKPQEMKLTPLNVAIKLPEGYWGMFAARSSLVKKGLMLANGIAIIDPDFAGDTDEYRAALYNRSDSPVIVERGERIVQLLILPVHTASIIQVTKLSGSARGGFGTTGAYELPSI